MSNFEIRNADGYLDGDCFGLWDMSDACCTSGKCLVAKYCEDKAKRGTIVQEEAVRVQDVVLTEEERKLPDIPPMDYMLDLLKGRFEHTTKENDKATAHYFLKEGKNAFTIIIAKMNGKIKLQSPLCASRVMDSIESIEQVESIVKEMLG